MMPHTRYYRIDRHTPTAVTMANGESTRATYVDEAMFPVGKRGIALSSLL
jgi:hypothetical protein